MEELREKRGLVYSCWSQWEFVAGRCVLLIDAWGEARKMKEICQIIAQTACATARDISQEEIDASRQRCRAGLMMGEDDLERRAEALIEAIIDGESLTNAQEIALYHNIEKVEILQAGKELLALDPVSYTHLTLPTILLV